MDSWDSTLRPVRSGYNPQDVQRIVYTKGWQRFRLSLKGLSTQLKLDKLVEWYDGNTKLDAIHYTKWEREVQVGNYLGALRRGGQLNMNNEVQR